MPAHYDPATVALSFALALVGAFVALTATEQLDRVRGSAQRVNLVAASVALGGIGVWAMHFTGMLALRVGMGVSYSLPETGVSLLAAVAACGAALKAVSSRPSLKRLLVAGTVLGLAVCVMHYLGMAGMRFHGVMQWNPVLVGASVLIAVIASTAGLWLALVVRGAPARVGASAIIAAAVCAMHYTGMAAADFVCTSSAPLAFPTGRGLLTSLELSDLVTFVSFGMAAIIAVDQLLQRGARSAAGVATARGAYPRR